jgi:hypothetical protein
MKKINTIFSLMIVLTMSSASMYAEAQGREQKANNDRRNHSAYRDRNDDKKNHGNHDRHDKKGGNHYSNKHHGQRHYERRAVAHVHHHNRYCDHRDVVVHRYAARPRYVYYRDYNVYYDCQKSVYISLSGRTWTVTSSIPIGMRQVNVRDVRRYEVDYYNDDFTTYLQRSRPVYGKEYIGW